VVFQWGFATLENIKTHIIKKGGDRDGQQIPEATTPKPSPTAIPNSTAVDKEGLDKVFGFKVSN
jgi:hypothetical protein